MSRSSVYKLNLVNKSFVANPQQAFEELRSRGDVFLARLPLIGKTWLATSHAAAREVFQNSDAFARDPKRAGRSSQFSLQWLMPSLARRMTNNMLSKDGEDHRRLRGLADKAFQRRNVDAMRERMQAIALEQLELARRQPNRQGAVDLVEHFARQLPLAVICELLGLPDEDREKFTKWFAGLSNVTGTIGILRGMLGVGRGYKYIRQQIQSQRASPRDGLIAELIRAEEDGERLSTEELESTVLLLLLAGHETTVHLISVSILALLRMPDVRERFLSSDEHAVKTVQELLRHEAVAQYGKPRWAIRDIRFHGVDIQRGDPIMPVVAAANFDPAVFENPHEFDIDRENNNRHLTFGSGPHVCIGLKLAEAETRIALEAVFGCYPEIAPTFDLQQPPWGKRMGMRSLRELPVTFG